MRALPQPARLARFQPPCTCIRFPVARNLGRGFGPGRFSPLHLATLPKNLSQPFPIGLGNPERRKQLVGFVGHTVSPRFADHMERSEWKNLRAYTRTFFAVSA